MAESTEFKVLLESAPDAIVLADSDGAIELVNRRTEELFGYDRSELLGRDVELLVPERFRGAHVGHRAHYAGDPRTREMGLELELYGRRKDGTEFPVEISLSPVEDEERLRVVTIVRDVSERRAADTRFRVLLESAPDAIVLADAGGRIALVNRRTEELFGYDSAELIGQEVELLVPERFHGAHIGHRAGYVRDPRSREMGAGLELFGRRKDGTEFPVEISLSPMHVGGETLVVTIVRDVSERRAAEQERLALAREQAAHAEADSARERLATILGEIDVIVWEADAERRQFSFVSRRAEAILGYPVATWLGERGFWRRLVHPDDLELAELSLREAAGRKEHHELEYRLRTADGRVVRIRDRIRITQEEGEVRLRGVMVDVTTHRELEERLVQSQKLEAVGQLAGGVAHDFNNVLTVITGYVNLVMARVEDTRARAELTEVRRAAERAAALTAQLLAFSRRAPSHSELIELHALLGGIEPMLRRLIDEDITLTIYAPPSSDVVRADKGQLEQVIVNLVVNARDAMPGGGEIRIETNGVDLDDDEAAEHGLPGGRYCVLSVADTGSGMTPETLGRIFEPFFTTKEQGKGTGLGLATVFGIAEQAGGRVVAESELGRGSTFAVFLPSAASAAEEIVEEVEGSSASILVVEDEPALRALARSVLETHGYRVFEAGNGREALVFAERHPGRINLVLTDVVMPDVNGPELVARLATIRPGTKVLYMSGYADSRLVNRGIAEGRAKILRKPFTPDELAQRVASLLAE